MALTIAENTLSETDNIQTTREKRQIPLFGYTYGHIAPPYYKIHHYKVPSYMVHPYKAPTYKAPSYKTQYYDEDPTIVDVIDVDSDQGYKYQVSNFEI